MKVKIISGVEKDVLETNINDFISNPQIIMHDIKFKTTFTNGFYDDIVYTAMIIYDMKKRSIIKTTILLV